ncbi:MAG: zf-TFIIB domain-containing protein [Chloroflexota bacterium]
MNCPKCESLLVKKYYKGMMEIDYCPGCRGMWLDFDELDKLEDTVNQDDRNKGSLIHREEIGNWKCPICGDKLLEFQYRLYDLRLELCANNHGFWLDAGEDERVIQIMQTHIKSIHRKKGAESEWKMLLHQFHSFVNRS